MTAYYLLLLQIMGCANPRSLQLLRKYGGAKEVCTALLGGDNGFLKPHEQQNLTRASLEKAEECLRYCEDSGYRVVTLDDEDYPLTLKNIYNAPILLFVHGDIRGLNDEISINIIGTREPCAYSYEVTEFICTPLAKTGIVIVSGMATGIDHAAQRFTVAAGGRTIGVLACGIDVDYPRGSMEFRRQMIACGGAVVSELMPGVRTDRGYFKQRNRIMSGIAQGTLIIEAAEASGCHLTAVHAISQNRDLFCVPPGNLMDPRFAGVVKYIRDGATPVFSYLDVINEYRAYFGEKYLAIVNEAKQEIPRVKLPRETGQLSPAERIVPQDPPKPVLSGLSGDMLKIAQVLEGGRRTIDQISRETGIAVGELNDVLLEMELDGVVRDLPGAMIQLA